MARGLAAACAVASLAAGASAGRAPVAAAALSHIDGISDQSLPAWDGSFAASGFAQTFRDQWAGGANGVSMARYVVQWNVAAQPAGAPDPHGDYRQRLLAWLADVRALALTPVLALTSYDGVRPATPASYAAALAALLAVARAAGEPVAYVEPWNEPNDQGRLRAAQAARLADAAEGVCQRTGCTVIAGDLLDRTGMLAYERTYVAALGFTPRLWGVHPYEALARHETGMLHGFLSALPRAGAGVELWFTEVGALYCRHGRLLGQVRQAADAAYLRVLLADPLLSPTHAFYYGFLDADGRSIACTGGADDSELYEPDGRPRAAARVLGEGVSSARAAAFGPAVNSQLTPVPGS